MGPQGEGVRVQGQRKRNRKEGKEIPGHDSTLDTATAAGSRRSSLPRASSGGLPDAQNCPLEHRRGKYPPTGMSSCPSLDRMCRTLEWVAGEFSKAGLRSTLSRTVSWPCARTCSGPNPAPACVELVAVLVGGVSLGPRGS